MIRTTPDNKGNQPVAKDGPIAYWATLPIKKMVANIRTTGISRERVELGGHIRLQPPALRRAPPPRHSGQAHIPAGFVHIPYLPEQMAVRKGIESQYPTMGVETLIKGFTAMIEALD